VSERVHGAEAPDQPAARDPVVYCTRADTGDEKLVAMNIPELGAREP
jgi:hypothetical protein